MKYLFFWILLLGISSQTAGQITITQADMPGNGDTLRYSLAAPGGTLPFNLSGANQVWDFSALTPTSQDIDDFKASLLTPYAFFFLGLNKYGRKITDSIGVGAFSFKDIYNFYRKTAQVFDVEGIGLRFQGIPLPAYYTDRDELYQFPLTYLRRDSSTFKFTISLPTLATYSQVGYRINEVEGWGTIMTPFGTFNCLKIKSTVISADSLNIGGFPVKFSQNRIEYKWLANGIKIPVMEISGNLIGNNFLPTTVKYRDIKRSNVLLQPPVANFTASPTLSPIFGNVQFTNTSLGNFLQYQWTFEPSDNVNFENGTSDTSKNPTVSFWATGQYNVKLRATNFLGQDEELKNQYITVFDPTSIKNKLPENEKLNFGQKEFWIPENFRNGEAVLINLNGKILPLQRKENQFFPVGKQDLTPGLYLIRISLENNFWSEKFVLGK